MDSILSRILIQSSKSEKKTRNEIMKTDLRNIQHGSGHMNGYPMKGFIWIMRYCKNVLLDI